MVQTINAQNVGMIRKVSRIGLLFHDTDHETSCTEKSALQVKFLHPKHAEMLGDPVGKKLNWN
jgi:hypothetical protein